MQICLRIKNKLLLTLKDIAFGWIKWPENVMTFALSHVNFGGVTKLVIPGWSGKGRTARTHLLAEACNQHLTTVMYLLEIVTVKGIWLCYIFGCLQQLWFSWITVTRLENPGSLSTLFQNANAVLDVQLRFVANCTGSFLFRGLNTAVTYLFLSSWMRNQNKMF